MKDIIIFNINIPSWLVFPVLYVIWLAGCFLIKKLCYRAIQRFAARTKSKIDDIVLEALHKPLALFILVSGAVVLQRFIPFPLGTQYSSYFFILLRITTIVAIVMFLDRLVRLSIISYANEIDFLQTSGGIIKGVMRGIIIGIGLLILLDSFGVSITPILASLGVGSLAVALALQPTLENFFGGMQAVIDRTIKVGHFIRLESGEEGYVVKIGWRSTWIKTLPNNILVIPNKILVSSKILNYYYPEPEMAMPVEIAVHYQSDLKQVEKITLEVARDILKTANGAVPTFEPVIRYHTLGDFSVKFSVMLRVKEFSDMPFVKHEFIKALLVQYKKAGIVIPYPVMTVNYVQEKVNG